MQMMWKGETKEKKEERESSQKLLTLSIQMNIFNRKSPHSNALDETFKEQTHIFAAREFKE